MFYRYQAAKYYHHNVIFPQIDSIYYLVFHNEFVLKQSILYLKDSQYMHKELFMSNTFNTQTISFTDNCYNEIINFPRHTDNLKIRKN